MPASDSSATAPEGLDGPAVAAWMAERVDVSGSLTWTAIPGGRSNLTYRGVDDAGRAWVLRRPPLHAVLASAHDVGREHRIMAGLRGSEVPVPPLVGHEPDEHVIGAPFYVMEFVDGHVVRHAADAAGLDRPARARAAAQLAQVLARLHAIEPTDVGLGELGRRQDYLARQLHRWRGQYDQGRSRDVPVIESLHERLAATIPDQQGAAIVHGDYRLDNVIVDDDGTIVAVLDWELCTLGDPLADLGLLAVYWDPLGSGHDLPLIPAAGGIEGMGDVDAVLAAYAATSTRDLSKLDWYRAFGYWKLAVILEGVVARMQAGAYGDIDDDLQRFRLVVPALAERGAELADDLGI